MAQTTNMADDKKIDPQIRTWLTKINAEGKGKTPVYKLPGTGPSDAITALQNKTPVDISGVEITAKTIMQDGISVAIHILRPEGTNEKLPVIMFFHGGVWIVGNFENHKRLARDLAVGSNAVVVFVDYTLIPNAVYPTQINQAYAATKWVSENGNEINVDGSRIAVAGNSVGGNMATVVALMAKDKNGPALRMQLLLYPSVDVNFETASYKAFANDRFLTRDFMIYGYDIYAPDAETRKNIYVAPLKANRSQLKGLPFTLIQTAENDVLRDEGEAYGIKLTEAGVETVVTRYNGLTHDFTFLNFISKLPASQSSLKQACAELKSHLK